MDFEPLINQCIHGISAQFRRLNMHEYISPTLRLFEIAANYSSSESQLLRNFQDQLRGTFNNGMF